MRLSAILTAIAILVIICCAGNNPAWANPKVPKKKIVSLKTSSIDGPSGIAKASYQAQTSRWKLQVVATGLPADSQYQLLINGRPINSAHSDQTGAIEFTYRYQASNTNQQLKDRVVSAIRAWRALRDISIIDANGKVVVSGSFANSIDGDIEPKAIVDDVTVEVNKVVTLPIISSDPNGDSVVYTVACDKGSFVSLTGITITVAPKDGDLGFYACKLTATDRFNLSTEAFFGVTVIPANKPPTIASVPDQTVRVGDVKRITVQATDPNGDVLNATLTSNVPAVNSIKPNGGNSFVIELAPKSEGDGGRVTVQVTDPGGLTAQFSFNIVVEKLVMVTAANRVKPNLFISGTGFGSAAAKVMINGVDVSAKVVGQSNTSITVRGPNKKLNIKSGANQLIVIAGGISSQSFIFNALTD